MSNIKTCSVYQFIKLFSLKTISEDELHKIFVLTSKYSLTVMSLN